MRPTRLILRSALAAAVASAVLAVPAAADGQFSTGPSCAVSCITTALVEPHTTAFGITVETDTPARIFIGVSDLLAQDGSWIDHATSGPGITAWGNHLTGLEPDTLYKVTVSATDALSRTDRRTTFVRTLGVQPALPEGPGGVQSNVGCSQQCISAVRLAPGGTGAGMTIDTTVPAKLTVAVDDDAPGTIDGSPFFGSPEDTFSTPAYATRAAGIVAGLAPGTLHHVIVRATDASGRTAYQQGIFRTKARRATLDLEDIRVSYDGDKGANRGEMRFRVAVNQLHQPTLRIGERKVASGNRLEFPDGGRSGGLVELAPLSRGLNVAVQAHERDHAPTCFDRTGTELLTPDSGRTDGWCDKWTWVTARKVVDLDAHVPGGGASPAEGGTGRHAIELTTSATAGIRFVVRGHVDVRYE